jgi:Tfp pilus assembly protein PilO
MNGENRETIKNALGLGLPIVNVVALLVWTGWFFYQAGQFGTSLEATQKLTQANTEQLLALSKQQWQTAIVQENAVKTLDKIEARVDKLEDR